MAYRGKLIGALLGSLAGPMGSLLGGLIGHLYDRAAEERNAEEQGLEAAGLLPGGKAAAPPHPDAISSAQLQFLTALIGLQAAVAHAGARPGAEAAEALKAFFQEHFPYGPEDQQLLANLIEEIFANQDRLEVQALCRHFLGVSTPEGRRLLVRLLLKIASADRGEVRREEERLVRRIAAGLNIEAGEYRLLAAEFTAQGGWAFRTLGLEPSATDEQIRSAYRRLAAENHPDRVACLGSEFVRVAEERFKQLRQAYEELRAERGL